MRPDEADRLVQQTLDKYARYVNPGLARLYRFANVLTLEWEASGAVIRDVYGREYIDCSGGPAVFAVGHRHPAVVAAVREQLDRMPMSVRAMPRRLEADLAEALAEITPGDLQYTFFVNSGAEAVEGALKLARLATGRTEFVAAEGAFHGKTLGALSVSGRDVYRAPFQPLLPGVTHVPFGDLDALARAVTERTAAVILEPIQGENGVIVPPDDYLRGARQICDRAGALLILDEVQTGLGRTGAMFACQHWGVVPDILTLAKALGGGVMPIGAFTARPHLWAALERNPYLHSSTFGGNPLACAAALATLRVLREENLPARAAALGEHLMARLRDLAARHPGMVRQVRGKGLLVGVEFTDPDLVLLVTAEALQRGVIVFYSLNNPSTFRIAPPLVIAPEQLDRAVGALEDAVAAVEALLADAVGELRERGSAGAHTGG
ncbi:MAG: aminotransferase class III-fold pyridoxal phosphate-dependent enzyme [Armatimonadota bacterium]|nr:aminotransferase class III-fold pyridoxal phosphate-dependent enzyme [Armatimonadota bacterium]MDR7402463.1 aminotransferase class III-fold pyridoxal phosphate-dependent enzyme [Armatimonadota bacterium]MDR7403786.1 aminotransferase class III-fold pyridoxal phosphate-dependent enzyme [Armatimonadota bacterium]MDR7437850.1 aminotransferase class III-fold pyridoxal phosphate-dependent enzyme [Armatimonadota bacterium]MDR7472110.1 aminotransferase class III-fold pyridoxal phosphate-dependent en